MFDHVCLGDLAPCFCVVIIVVTDKCSVLPFVDEDVVYSSCCCLDWAEVSVGGMLMDCLSHASIFLFVIFIVHESADRRLGSGLALGNIFPFLKKPMLLTAN